MVLSNICDGSKAGSFSAIVSTDMVLGTQSLAPLLGHATRG